MTTEQLAAAYDDGWTMAIFATSPADMNGEDQLLRALRLPPADNPHREAGSPAPARLATRDRGALAFELTVAVDGTTAGVATWVGIVDALVASGALLEVSDR